MSASRPEPGPRRRRPRACDFEDLVQGLEAIVWEAEAETLRFTFVSQRAEDMLGYPIEQWVEPGFWSAHVHPGDQDRMTAFFHAPDAGAPQREIEFRMLDAGGRTVWLRSLARLEADGAGTSFLRGVMVDITARKRDEEELQARAAQQAAVAEFGQRALAGVEPPRLMEEAAALTARTLASDFSHVLELLPDGRALQLRAGVGWDEVTAGDILVLADAGSLGGHALQAPGPVVIEDLPSETRFEPPAFLRDHGVRSGVLVVIGGRRRPFGILGAHSRKPRRFSPHEIYFLQAIANVLANAIARKRVEDALRESLSIFRAVAEGTTDVVFVKDLRGRYLMINSAGIAYMGRPAAELLGKTDHDLFSAETAEALAAADRLVLETGETRTFEEPGTAAGGVKTYLSIKGPYRDAEGRVVGLIGIARDITERKRYEEALRRSEELYRTVARNIPGGAVALFDRDLRYLIADGPELLQAVGLTKAAIEGKLLRELVPRETYAQLEPALRGALAGQRTILELPLAGRYFLCQAVPVKNDTGEIVAGMAMVLDITARKTAEEALRANEERLRLALEAGRMGTWDWDVRTGRLRWSRTLEPIHGLEPETFPGTYEAFLELIHPEDRELFAQTVSQTLESGARFETEFRVVHPDGSVHWVAGKGEVHRDPSGVPVRMIGLGLDITDRKRAEYDLARHAEALARSNAELEQFAYVASHDLQEPLRMVASYVQLLARRYGGKLGPEADEFIQYAADGATRMQRLISDLLDFSRTGSGKREFERVELGAVLDQVLAYARPALDEAGGEVTRSEMPVVTGDASQLARLFQNLIGNAIKFRFREPLRVRISAELSRGVWLFSVADNGIGIDPRHGARIFEVFQRLHGKNEYPGTGIGLAICKKIVEHHGGRIWVEAQPGQGATFLFTLPAG